MEPRSIGRKVSIRPHKGPGGDYLLSAWCVCVWGGGGVNLLGRGRRPLSS